jgi:arylsulfatase A-like enzyme
LGNKPALRGVLRNGHIVPKDQLTHLTDDFSAEAVRFVERNREQPFFLYLAYNAPHAPDHATREHLKRTEHIEYGGRAVYGAMVAAMDAGIGQVVEKLKERGLYDNTLIFFYSDNGGRGEHAVNYPFRGHKGMLFEGGIRVPFCLSWPERIPEGQRYDYPITALDIFPTALAAADVSIPESLQLDGVNLLPYLRGEDTDSPHQTLYWRYACGKDRYGYAVRHGRHKLVYSVYKESHLLFDMEEDPWEREDLAAGNAPLVDRLILLYQAWSREMIAPKWLDPHGPNVAKEEANRQSTINAASRGERTD